MYLTEKVNEVEVCDEIKDVGFHYGSHILDAPKIIKAARRLEDAGKDAWQIITKNCQYINSDLLIEGLAKYEEEAWKTAANTQDDKTLTSISATIKYVQKSVEKIRQMYN